MELANQPGRPCRATNDVTLSGLNARGHPAELGMIALFAIISVDNDYFAIVVTQIYKRRPMAPVGGVRRFES